MSWNSIWLWMTSIPSRNDDDIVFGDIVLERRRPRLRGTKQSRRRLHPQQAKIGLAGEPGLCSTIVSNTTDSPGGQPNRIGDIPSDVNSALQSALTGGKVEVFHPAARLPKGAAR